jgi:hypothetical protein
VGRYGEGELRLVEAPVEGVQVGEALPGMLAGGQVKDLPQALQDLGGGNLRLQDEQ